MMEISFSAKDLESDKENLAIYLAVNHDYDEIADILSFKKALPFPEEKEEKAAFEERFNRFTAYMKDYKLEWGTYLDDTIKSSVTHECAIAYRGNLDNFLKTNVKVGVESAFHVDNALLEHEKKIPFWTINKIDDDFVMAVYHKPTNDSPFADPDEQCAVLGRSKTIVHMIYHRCTNLLATKGEDWFAQNVSEEFGDIIKKEMEAKAKGESTDSSKYHFVFLFAIPGKSGCKCNKLIKSFVWKLADAVSDVLE